MVRDTEDDGKVSDMEEDNAAHFSADLLRFELRGTNRSYTPVEDLRQMPFKERAKCPGGVAHVYREVSVRATAICF